jgi:hypothetical protein
MASQRRFVLALLVVLAAGAGCSVPAHLAVAHGNRLTIVNPDTAQSLQEITTYQEVMRLGYRPDGARLAAAVCFGNRVVELEPPGYAEVASPVTAAACPWALGYSPDTLSLAATIPFRPDPRAALFGHLWIGGPQPLDRDMGRPLPALAYRPGGGEIAVSTPTGLTVLSTAAGYPVVVTLPGVMALSLGYTTDGARLLVGTPAGFQVRSAGAGYALLSEDTAGAVTDIAVAPNGGWIALVRGGTVSVRRAPDLVEAVQLTSTPGSRDADFSPGGAMLAVAEQSDQVRRFSAGTWQELSPIAVTGRVDAIAFRPRGFGTRVPVLFVHGHSGDSNAAWFEPAGDTSVAAALAANPQLRIDAFYLELPVHGSGQNLTRSITDDAQDILAMIEGGLDSQGRTQVGILNMPAYQTAGRVAIVAYSQGTLSSRFYLKNLMGTRKNGAITVSEFVSLAAPNHGVGDALSCGTGFSANEPDRTRRQLCAGRAAVVLTQTCGQCPAGTPIAFSTNQPGDDTFITDLNGHGLGDSCTVGFTSASEAPSSRPTLAAGVLYVNAFAPDDELVGGGTQGGDCFGRRLARNLAPDAVNLEITGVPSVVHANFPHHWPTICTALRTVTDHQAPDPAQACTGLTHP